MPLTRSAVYVSSLVAAGFMSASAVWAQPAETFPVGEGYLFQEVAKDPALAQQFAEITAPLTTHFSWVAKFGTASPAQEVKVDGKTYTVYQGCKPHNCPAESYVVLYDTSSKKMLAGAFVQNQYEQGMLMDSKVSWLGAQSTDFAPTLSSFLF